MNPPCPLLPTVHEPLTAADIAALGKDRGPEFYMTSLRFAQSLWQSGLPGQAILQINRALACVFDSSDPVLIAHPLPYRSLCWILQNCPEFQFMGNPRRHWQHLATRMVEPHKELRTWRAWACWYLAKSILPPDQHPADLKQIRAEGIVEPTFQTIAQNLRDLSSMNDEWAWKSALEALGVASPQQAPHIRIIEIGIEQLGIVHELAHRIWPQVYPSIISNEQIQFMLRQRYELSVLEADVREKGARYALIYEEREPAGYIGIEPRPDHADLFLQKLYLLPECAGKGMGAAALAWVADQARGLGLKTIRLVVNKLNTNAIRAYLRAGFAFEADVVTDIGNGFVMDDYQMIWRL